MSFTEKDLFYFIMESNKIEGIIRSPFENEINEARRFLNLETISVEDLEKFVSVYQPGAKLRTKHGMDVRVGNHVAPPGGFEIKILLESILLSVEDENHPFNVHQAYETLHPFTDGNGRSGRMLWAWQMINQEINPGIKLGFLHAFYYQSLEFSRK